MFKSILYRVARVFGAIGQMFRRPRYRQVAALVWREDERGSKEVLLITTRRTGRWTIPKGWPIDGLSSSEAAAQEAWEEAGVRGQVNPHPSGSFDYRKGQTPNRPAMRMTATVFRLRLSEISDEFPEAGQRKREWHSPADAAKLVREPGLCDILGQLGN